MGNDQTAADARHDVAYLRVGGGRGHRWEDPADGAARPSLLTCTPVEEWINPVPCATLAADTDQQGVRMRALAVLLGTALVASLGYSVWRVQQLETRLDQLLKQATAPNSDVLELRKRFDAFEMTLSARNEELESKVADLRPDIDGLESTLSARNDELESKVADLRSDLDQAPTPADPTQASDGVFQTFRGPVSIEDIYFELVDDEFEGIPNSRIDRLDDCEFEPSQC